MNKQRETGLRAKSGRTGALTDIIFLRGKREEARFTISLCLPQRDLPPQKQDDHSQLPQGIARCACRNTGGLFQM